MKKTSVILSLLFLTACAGTTQSVIPLGNDRVEISTSGRGRQADIAQIVIQKAARTTIDMDFDKFVVIKEQSWDDAFQHGLHSGTRPENKLTIQMFHNGEAGAGKAIDARSILAVPPSGQ